LTSIKFQNEWSYTSAPYTNSWPTEGLFFLAPVTGRIYSRSHINFIGNNSPFAKHSVCPANRPVSVAAINCVRLKRKQEMAYKFRLSYPIRKLMKTRSAVTTNTIHTTEGPLIYKCTFPKTIQFSYTRIST
jgi:hypothetical protein